MAFTAASSARVSGAVRPAVAARANVHRVARRMVLILRWMAGAWMFGRAGANDKRPGNRECPRFRVTSGDPSQGPSGERLATARRRRNTPGNAQAKVRRRLMGSGERPRRGAHRRGAVPARPVPDLSGHRTEGRRVAVARRLFFSDSEIDCRCASAHLSIDTHVAAGARMVDFGGWDMPVALRLPDRGAPCRTPRRRHVRRLAHVRGRPARRARPRFPAAAARERRREAHAARQGALLAACCARTAASSTT